MNNRIKKINELIRFNIDNIFLKELSLKAGVFLTISKVDTTSDLRYTRVFISVFPEKEIPYIEKTLKKEIFNIQGRMNKKLFMRPLPKIEFKIDMTEAKADEIEKILREID